MFFENNEETFAEKVSTLALLVVLHFVEKSLAKEKNVKYYFRVP